MSQQTDRDRKRRTIRRPEQAARRETELSSQASPAHYDHLIHPTLTSATFSSTCSTDTSNCGDSGSSCD